MKVYIGDFLSVTETLSGSHAERVTAGEGGFVHPTAHLSAAPPFTQRLAEY